MSDSGQSLPKWVVRATSVFPPIATELRTSRIGSFVPTGDMSVRLALPRQLKAPRPAGSLADVTTCELDRDRKKRATEVKPAPRATPPEAG